MGSATGSIRTAARRLGLTDDEYAARVGAGEKWCRACRAWHLREAFPADCSRGDGLDSRCRDARRREPRPRVPADQRRQARPPLAAPRDGDKVQARHRINYLVASGAIPAPSELPCTDCGRSWVEGGSRHEYDHYLGYAAEHHEDVQAVCSPCHRKRATA
jgi:hypothetical protein